MDEDSLLTSYEEESQSQDQSIYEENTTKNSNPFFGKKSINDKVPSSTMPLK